MPSDPVELTKAIKAACDIVSVVGSYLTLKPAGATFKGLCPFHDDTRPSLDVDPRRQRYRCWACGAYGDVFQFVMAMEKVDFREARAILARRAGIRLEDESSSGPASQRRRWLEVLQWAQQRYHECLRESDLAETARKYLGERGLHGGTVRDFGLGYAPLAGEWLLQQARRDLIDPQILVETGLLLARQENRGWFDRFRDRIMFPIRDPRGQVIAFGGRILPSSPLATRAPKYYNSAETPLFSKSEVLYGLDRARPAAVSAGYLVIVEGYTDVLMAHQCGFAQVVATMGTALTARHISLIRRFVPKVILVFDADAGGLTGTDRALELFLTHDLEVAIATLPPGLDPCDLLAQSHGPTLFAQALASACDALEFKLHRLFQQYDTTTLEGTRRVLDAILQVIAVVPEHSSPELRVKKELMINRLAHRLRLRSETVWDRLEELRKHRQTTPPAACEEPVTASTPSAARVDPQVVAEKQLVEILLADPALLPQACAVWPAEAMRHPRLRRILSELYAIHHSGGIPDLDALRERLFDRPDLYDDACRLHLVGQHMQDRGQWLQRVLQRLQELRLAAERQALKEQLAAADAEQAVALLRRWQQTHRGVQGSPGL
ncbi:DNA primase [Thermogemmata fonticola]|uniref:DNA primase n=1 Tax=Thermogemmata fonticola TaxID=2755323 RepID=A0A7V9ACA3_9BACT|nr:DNA primase [Thermogemmata fonticola]MBA2226582.1 DNA primase [Thermogemmata fonticola]